MIKKLLESLNTIESAVDETVLGSTKPYFYKKYASADQKVPDQQILGHEPKSDTHGDQFWGGCAEEEGVEQTQAPIEEDLIAHLANEFADFLRDRAPILDDILPNAEDHELGQRASDRDLIASEGLDDPEDNPCWKGYYPVGTKEKDGRKVPNCVPKK